VKDRTVSQHTVVLIGAATSRTLRRLVGDGIRRVTANPTISARAIEGSTRRTGAAGGGFPAAGAGPPGAPPGT